MKPIFSLVLLLLLFQSLESQEFTSSTALPVSMNETSGLINLNGTIISHNDSGSSASLYELDPSTGNVLREVTVSNAINTDWEDITNDNQYIYIADFGNNLGSRTDLKVYRVLISDYINTSNSSVTADVINFSYSDQTDFTPNQYNTNFDAEALISWGSNLYIFTKNWGDFRTDVYELPKTPGTYSINKVTSYDSMGMITGGTYNPVSNSILLTGYTFLDPFVIEISDFSTNQFFNGTVERSIIQMPSGFSYQIEAVDAIDQSQYYVTSEDHFSGSSGLYTFQTEETLSVEISDKDPIKLFPNPTSGILNIRSEVPFEARIYDISGKLIFTSNQGSTDVSNLAKGVYSVKVIQQNGRTLYRKLIIAN